MANGKILFKHEADKIQEIKESLAYSQTLKGSQVILSEGNQKKLREAVELLSKATALLNEIK